MKQIPGSGWYLTQISVFTRVLQVACLMVFVSLAGNTLAGQVDTEVDSAADQPTDYTEEMAEATDEVNTNDPTAAAISVSFGWEFFDWHEDEIAPGQTRPLGNDNNFNSRIVMPLAAGTLGSPCPIINRFSFANVEAPGGTSGSGNAEFISLFIPKPWATGKIGI